MERNEDSIPEPILRLRKTSALRLLRSFDHSGEETTRVYDDAMGEKESNGDGGGDTSGGGGGASDHLRSGNEDGDSSRVDPPARERPAVRTFLQCLGYLFCSFLIVQCD